MEQSWTESGPNGLHLTRMKIYPMPGSAYRFAWRYWYTVRDLTGAKIAGDFDTLADARSWLKRNAARLAAQREWKNP